MKNSILKYSPLFVQPILIGGVGALIWYFLHEKIAFNVKDQGIFEPLLVLIGIAHSTIASLQVQKVNEQNQKIEQAMFKGDIDQFESYACLRISPVIKLLLAVFSFIFFGIFLFYPFSEDYAGIITVWVTLFVLYLIWKIASELDDPFQGITKITPDKIREVFGGKINVDELMERIRKLRKQ